MKRLLGIVFLLAIPLSASAQITVSVADIAPRIGDRLEYVLQSFAGPISESVGGIGMTGGPLVVDVRDGLGDPLVSLISTSEILLPQDAPGSEKYPEAEFVVRSTDTGEGHEPSYAFFADLAARPVCWDSRAKGRAAGSSTSRPPAIWAASPISIPWNSANSSLPSKCH